MISVQIPINPLLLPTGEFQIPVCVGDMPSQQYQVAITVSTESVVSYLNEHPNVPGVILVDGDKLHSALSRSRIFERLSHQYGVELFLRKPILELQKNLNVQTYTILSHVRIEDAIRIALGRSPQDMYDPLIVLYEQGEMCILDVYALLLAQSQSLQSMNALMGSLTRIEQTITSGLPLEHTLDLLLSSLRKVVPFHRTAIHVKDSHFRYIAGTHSVLHSFEKQLTHNMILKTVLNIRQPLHAENVDFVPAWEKSGLFSETRAWVGMPLLNSQEPFGVLSLMRFTRSPFSKAEMDMTNAFVDLMSHALYKAMDTSSNIRAIDEYIPDSKLSL